MHWLFFCFIFPGSGRVISKQQVRAGIIEKFNAGRDADVETLVAHVQSDVIQNALGNYVQMMKKKATKTKPTSQEQSKEITMDKASISNAI